MDNNVYKKTVEYLPMFFECQLQFDPYGAGIFEPLRNIINFDEAYIFFLNPDSIQLKYLYGINRSHAVDDLFSVDIDIKRELFSLDNKIFDSNGKLTRLLELEHNNSFLTSKLVIRNTVYGFVLLCKKEESFYKQEDIEVATALGSVISYKIKDIELSDIFKIQLKALQDGLVQTKLAYKTIKQQNFQILESDRVKNEFLANISHELRTPLNAIIGFSEILSNNLFGDLNPKQAEYVQDIHISGIHLLGMINEILDISKIEARAMTLNRSEFSISRAVEEIVNMVKPLADKKSIVIEKNIKEDITVFADFQKIRQVLYNLLSNAIKFSPENDTILVNVHFDIDNFYLEVQDNGSGISLNDQERIFAKFVQLENAYTKTESSTGLGLTITKEFVEMHNGEIFIESDVGRGAKFVVKIPFNSDDSNTDNVVSLLEYNQ